MSLSTGAQVSCRAVPSGALSCSSSELCQLYSDCSRHWRSADSTANHVLCSSHRLRRILSGPSRELCCQLLV